MQRTQFDPPPKLYDLCLKVAVADCMSICNTCRKEFRFLPNNVLLDFYYRMLQEKRLCLLAFEFSDLNVFSRLLYVKHKRLELLKCFQSLVDHGTNVAEALIRSFAKYAENDTNNQNVIDLGLRIGIFFDEGGWFPHSIKILNITENLCLKEEQSVGMLKKLLECYQQRLYPEAIHCNFEAAEKTVELAKKIIEKLQELNAVPNLAGLYSNFSLFYFIRSEYQQSYFWAQKALELLTDEVPVRVIIEVLRQASKSCVVKRKFKQAGLLIRQATNLAGFLYEKNHLPCFSDTLMDYGFYLLNYDSIQESVHVYERALDIRRQVFDKNNIHVAIGHEDLAYALYVNEYSSGNFYLAKEHAERSIRIMEKVLPKNHLMLASVKRVKALILEEIALDERNNLHIRFQYLNTAELLHKTALELSHKAFGEKNVQTAKHYGNLGRLYQSLKYYEEAEKMHLKAIAIKEELLGPKDYEVALSIGHLASLYNYHMKKYREAEKLYLRSIDINLNLFGPAYSGLEYDYRGLIHVYGKLLEGHQLFTYTTKMREWKLLREKLIPKKHEHIVLSIKEILKQFFDMEEVEK